MDLTADLYELIGIKPDATSAQIREAYLKASKAAHPDHGGTDALFRLVNRAYETLSDPTQRAAYDSTRTTRPRGSQRAEPQSERPTGGNASDGLEDPDPMVRRCPDCRAKNRLKGWVSQTCGQCGATIILVKKG